MWLHNADLREGINPSRRIPHAKQTTSTEETLSSNSEVNSSELLETIEDISPHYLY